MQAAAGPTWNAIVNHPFVDALAAGTINDEAMRAYLVQDHRFLDHFVVLLASMVASAPTLKVRASRHIAMIEIDVLDCRTVSRAVNFLHWSPEKKTPILSGL
jgi:thiaminase